MRAVDTKGVVIIGVSTVIVFLIFYEKLDSQLKFLELLKKQMLKNVTFAQ